MAEHLGVRFRGRVNLLNLLNHEGFDRLQHWSFQLFSCREWTYLAWQLTQHTGTNVFRE